MWDGWLFPSRRLTVGSLSLQRQFRARNLGGSPRLHRRHVSLKLWWEATRQHHQTTGKMIRPLYSPSATIFDISSSYHPHTFYQAFSGVTIQSSFMIVQILGFWLAESTSETSISSLNLPATSSWVDVIMLHWNYNLLQDMYLTSYLGLLLNNYINVRLFHVNKRLDWLGKVGLSLVIQIHYLSVY